MVAVMSCCYGCNCRRQVAPAPWDEIADSLVEVRPNRFIHIKHLNQRPRDEQFQKEFKTFLQYRKKGVSTNMTIAAPKRQITSLNSNVNKTEELSNNQPGVPLSNTDATKLKTPSSTHSMLSASGVEVSVATPESVPSHEPQVSKSTDSNSVNQPEGSIPNGTKAKSNYPQSNGTDSRKDSNSVLFFLHGVGGSSEVWRAQLTYFQRLGYEVVAPDLIGHGLSCAPKESKHYHFDQMSADIEEIFDKFCKRNNVVIGHSYGCSFAAVLARTRSRRVTKLIMISGGGPTPLAPQPGVFSLPISLFSCLRPCVECKYKKSAFNGSKSIMSPQEAFAVPAYVLSHTMNGQIWPDGDELFHNWIISPTLLIYGRLDKLISLQEEEHMREAIYNSELEVIPTASHMVMIEEPDIVNTLIHQFLLKDYRLEGSIPVQHVHLEQNKSRTSLRSVKSIPNL